jgi:hypothetical protein
MIMETDAKHVPGGEKGAKSKEGPYKVLAEIVDISPDVLHDIANKKRLRSVSVENADKLAMHGDFSLDELYERAEEWAVLTGNDWPDGYTRKRRKPKGRRRKPGQTKKRILQLLAERPSDQQMLAHQLNLRSTSGASKPLQGLIAEGKVETYYPPLERRRKMYRLTEGQVGVSDGA